jgi:hypothetical protein
VPGDREIILRFEMGYTPRISVEGCRSLLRRPMVAAATAILDRGWGKPRSGLCLDGTKLTAGTQLVINKCATTPLLSSAIANSMAYGAPATAGSQPHAAVGGGVRPPVARTHEDFNRPNCRPPANA